MVSKNGIYVQLLEFKQSRMGSSFYFCDLLGAQESAELLPRFQRHLGASAWSVDPITQMEQLCRDSDCN